MGIKHRFSCVDGENWPVAQRWMMGGDGCGGRLHSIDGFRREQTHVSVRSAIQQQLRQVGQLAGRDVQ